MNQAEAPWFRELYEDILGYRRQQLFGDVLSKWLDKALLAVQAFDRFRSPLPYDRHDEDAQDAMWNLYALSRVNDLLLTAFQATANANKLAPIERYEYETFFTKIGFEPVEVEEFSPLHHEVVAVCQADAPDEPIGVAGHRWPGLMLGDMVFSRSGVEVTGGKNHIAKEVAENPTLYFTFRRQNRKTNDLSMGWGHNLQWRTSFRRDYRSAGKRIYNFDGRNSLSQHSDGTADSDGLTYEERVELCRNRCFIVTTKPDDDLWPYYDRFDEERE